VSPLSGLPIGDGPDPIKRHLVLYRPVAVASSFQFRSSPMRLLSSMTTVHYRLLAVLWTVGIVLAMSIPANDLTGMQPGLGLDKVVHVILFAGFGILWLRAVCPPDESGLPGSFRRRAGLFFVAGVLFAVGTEVYQHLLPVRRMADPYDVTADLIGFIIAFASYYVYHVRRADRMSA
jgi:VanZ family protein